MMSASIVLNFNPKLSIFQYNTRAAGSATLDRLRPYLPDLQPVAIGQAAGGGVITTIITIIIIVHADHDHRRAPSPPWRRSSSTSSPPSPPFDFSPVPPWRPR